MDESQAVLLRMRTSFFKGRGQTAGRSAVADTAEEISEVEGRAAGGR